MRHGDDGFYIRLELRVLIIACVLLGASQGLSGDNVWLATVFAAVGTHFVLFLTLTLIAILSYRDEGRSNRYAQKRANRKRRKRGGKKAGGANAAGSKADSRTVSQTMSATHSIDGLSLSQVSVHC